MKLGKTHPSTLITLLKRVITCMDGLNDCCPKAEEIYRRALNGYERSLRKVHKDTEGRARTLAIELEEI